ncbi:MAG: DNA replication and repair protein RecF, partial [Candidatus Hydrothermota bacterium]
MRIKNIDLTNFRNFRSASFRFEDGLNFIVGPNGVGKTNLLEAIAYLSVPKSFRNIRDNELVLWDESWFRIEGEVESEVGTAHRIAVVYS